MYTSENPHFNTSDKIILGLIMFSVLWIILKAFFDYLDGYGPYGWRWNEMVKRVEARKCRRRTHTMSGQMRRRRVLVLDDGNLREANSESSSDYFSDKYSTDSE